MNWTEFLVAHGIIAPSLKDNILFGTIRSGSNSVTEPNPSHFGHAPWGELNEKLAGVNSG